MPRKLGKQMCMVVFASIIVDMIFLWRWGGGRGHMSGYFVMTNSHEMTFTMISTYKTTSTHTWCSETHLKRKVLHFLFFQVLSENDGEIVEQSGLKSGLGLKVHFIFLGGGLRKGRIMSILVSIIFTGNMAL